MKHKGSGLSPSPDNIFQLIGRYCTLNCSYLRKRFLLGTSFFVFVNLRLEIGLALHLLVFFLQQDPVMKSAGPFSVSPVPSKSPCFLRVFFEVPDQRF